MSSTVVVQGGRVHWTVNYTCPQDFIITFLFFWLHNFYLLLGYYILSFWGFWFLNVLDRYLAKEIVKKNYNKVLWYNFTSISTKHQAKTIRKIYQNLTTFGTFFAGFSCFALNTLILGCSSSMLSSCIIPPSTALLIS